MPALDPTLRDQLATIIGKEGRNDGARVTAEAGARAALEALAVHRAEPYDHMPTSARELRKRLRARARQLGDRRFQDRTHEITRLVEQCAYEHWHRMLFARFLAENELLIHPIYDTPVSLEECAELASGEGAENQWELAGRFASRMLPQIFRPDDPVLAVKLAPEHQHELETLLSSLPLETFQASDALGWVYQFWQARRKKEVNQSEVKIGADELPAVTQLFTEPYMVQFLLHNTLGAWWAGKILSETPTLAEKAASEEELRAACALPGLQWSYLRFVRAEGAGWRPAAGTFDGWPKAAAELKLMDPCCGSGHFLLEAFNILVRLRIAEEGLSARSACDAVLTDNLFGLEIDQRCVQIAAFALAFAAWTFAGTGGYRGVPQLNIACSGLTIAAKKDEWVRLAGDDQRLQRGMERLHDLFSEASVLGSLIDPRRRSATPVLTAGFDELAPLLSSALLQEGGVRDPDEHESRVAAQGIARAGALLADQYDLVATNVPYLGFKKQHPRLKQYVEEHFGVAKHDLATTMMERLVALSRNNIVAVTPTAWTFQGSYEAFRTKWLSRRTFELIGLLGPSAFETISGEVVNVILVVAGVHAASPKKMIRNIDVTGHTVPAGKSALLRDAPVAEEDQYKQLRNPDCRFIFGGQSKGKLVSTIAHTPRGIVTGDRDKWARCFWEVQPDRSRWRFLQGTVTATTDFGGREHVIDWSTSGAGMLRPGVANESYGLKGVAVSQIGSLPVTLYYGDLYDNNVCAITPRDESDLAALWAYLSSDEYSLDVRKIDRKMNVTNATLGKVRFDAARWAREAEQTYPSGLPEPYSEVPSQWLFKGTVMPSEAPLQVAVARLLGYRWPDQKPDSLDQYADEDGVVCVPAVRGERSASDRLAEVLAAAYGQKWHPQRLVELLASVGYEGKTLEDWLRDGFFEQHCRLFGSRPFIWHIWDGHREGFSALVNCHKLDHKTLESLTYTYLGDWIRQQEQGLKAGASGAGDRLAKAKGLQQRLGAILVGEAPLDVFVRWKPLEQQPIGWQPDLDDGVRMNIRPFMLVQDVGRKGAGVLRQKPNIDWRKDRGKNPNGAPWGPDRHNDVHLSLDQKNAARELVAMVRAGNMPGPELLRQFRKRLSSLLSLDGRPPLFDTEVAEKLDAVGLWEE